MDEQLPPVRAKGRTLGYGQGSGQGADKLAGGWPNNASSHNLSGGVGGGPAGGHGQLPVQQQRPMFAPRSAPGSSELYNGSININGNFSSNNNSNISAKSSQKSGWTDIDGNFHPFVHTGMAMEKLQTTQGRVNYKPSSATKVTRFEDSSLASLSPSNSSMLDYSIARGDSNSSFSSSSKIPSLTNPNSKSYELRDHGMMNHLFQVDYIAIRIQKVVRGRICRKKLWRYGGKLYVHQVKKIQRVFRAFWSNKFKFMPVYVKFIHKMANKIKSVYYIWLYKQKKRILQAKFVARCVLYIQSLYRGREDRKKFRRMREAMRLAATIRIQKYARRYFARKRRRFLEFSMNQVWLSMKAVAAHDFRVNQVVGSGLRLQDLYPRPFEDAIEAMHVALTFLILIDRPNISMDIIQSIFWGVFEKIPSLKKVYQCILFSCWAAFGKTNDKKTEFLARALFLKFKESRQYLLFPDNLSNVSEKDDFLHDDLSGCPSIESKYPWFKDHMDISCSFRDIPEKIEILYFQNVFLHMKSNFRVRFLITSWALATFDLYLFNTITVDHSAIRKDTNISLLDDDEMSVGRSGQPPSGPHTREAAATDGGGKGLGDDYNNNISNNNLDKEVGEHKAVKVGALFSENDVMSLNSNASSSMRSAYALSGLDYSLVGRKHALLTDRYREWCENVCSSTSKMSLNNIKMTHQLILVDNIFGKFHKIIYKKMNKKFSDLRIVDYVKLRTLRERLENERWGDATEIRKALDNVGSINVIANFVVIQCGDCLIVQVIPKDVEIVPANKKFNNLRQKFKYCEIRDIMSDKWKETVVYPLFLTQIEVKFLYELSVVHFMKVFRMEYADIVKRSRGKNLGEYLELFTRLVSTVTVRKEKQEIENAEGGGDNLPSDSYDDDDSIGSDGSMQKIFPPIDSNTNTDRNSKASVDDRQGLGKNNTIKIEKVKAKGVGLSSSNSFGSLDTKEALDSEEEEAAKSEEQKKAKNALMMEELRDLADIEVHFRTVIPFLEYKRVEINDKNIYLLNILSIQRCFRGFLGRAKTKRIRLKKRDLLRQKARESNDLSILAAVKRKRYFYSSQIQAAMRGYLWRKNLAFLNRMACIVQNNTRIYLAKLELARRVRRKQFGPDLIMILKKAIAIDISMSSKNASMTGHNSVQSIGLTAPSTAISFLNQKSNEAVMSISLACVVWRCGNNYKITANNYVTNATYEGFVYWEQLAGIIEDYNILASDEISRTSKYSSKYEDDSIASPTPSSEQSSKQNSRPITASPSFSSAAAPSLSRQSSYNDNKLGSKQASKSITKANSRVKMMPGDSTIQGKNGDQFQMMKISISEDNDSASSAGVSQSQSQGNRVSILKIYHYERIAELLLTKIEVNPIAYEVLIDFRKFHGKNPKHALSIRNSNEYNTYPDLVEKINYPGLQKFFSSQSTVTLNVGNEQMQQQLHPSLMKSTRNITKGFDEKQIWESIAPIYSLNPNIIGAANLRDNNNFYQFKSESRLLRDQKSIAEKYFKYLKSKSDKIIITAGDQSMRHNILDKSINSASATASQSKKRAKTPEKKSKAIGIDNVFK